MQWKCDEEAIRVKKKCKEEAMKNECDKAAAAAHIAKFEAREKEMVPAEKPIRALDLDFNLISDIALVGVTDLVSVFSLFRFSGIILTIFSQAP